MKIVSLFIILSWAPIVFGAEDNAPETAIPETYISAKTIRENARRVNLKLRSHAALVFDERDNEIIMERNTGQVMPVASLSKLMTAMVILDADLDMDEVITISKADKDRLRYSRSRLRKGMKFNQHAIFRSFFRPQVRNQARFYFDLNSCI